MDAKLNQLKKAYPRKEITSDIAYFIGGSMVCTRKFLAVALNTTERSIAGWTTMGLPESEFSMKTMKLYDLEVVRQWHLDNIDQKRSKARGSVATTSVPAPDDSDLEVEINDINGKIHQANQMLQLGKGGTTIEGAERIDKILSALTKAVKVGKESGELIPKRDTEKVIIEMVSVMISGYKKDVKILPRECAKRSEAEIRSILESNHKSTIAKLQKLANSPFTSKKKMYDVLERVYEMLEEGITVDVILGRMAE